ncbi:hypothetical protein BDP27DRAFT_19450 [Rhodocollybia butyracea]|uniref:Methyltransferase domain-containing protein n=1 Tax=Rhodocollybia butyracea TaxID=206335 RepID=A0A9P5QBT8_9AGAR|nr:hypothetical protein BDP27DRAFT_19450 [Rhodocollybia butyracea]
MDLSNTAQNTLQYLGSTLNRENKESSLETIDHQARISQLIRLILETHPNTFASSCALASSNLDGVAELDRELGLHVKTESPSASFNWEDVLRAYITVKNPESESQLPPAICTLIAYVHANVLTRRAVNIPDQKEESIRGMSPKKAHEVTRMAAYVAAIVRSSFSGHGVYIVDVGAGQGHLSRALLDQVPNVRGVLALDGDAVLVERQAEILSTRNKSKKGDPKEEQRSGPKVTHKIGHIISAQGLVEAVDEWVADLSVVNSDRELPVVLVSLHGCGSLSLDVLRAFALCQHGSQVRRNKVTRNWGFAASITVPCCYNLLREGDYSLSYSQQSLQTVATGARRSSQKRTSYTNKLPRSLPTLLPNPLPPSAYHLAAQVPHTWISCEDDNLLPSASLAVRKVVWRALLERALQDAGHTPEDMTGTVNSLRNTDRRSRPKFIPPMEANTYASNFPSNFTEPNVGPSKIGSVLELRRLGRLPSRVYDSWESFIQAAGQRLGVDLLSVSPSIHSLPVSLAPLSRALAILHVLRCILGPLIESSLLADRLRWIQHELLAQAEIVEKERDTTALAGGTLKGYSASLVPLFSQDGDAGSARNIALVVLPLTQALDDQLKMRHY